MSFTRAKISVEVNAYDYMDEANANLSTLVEWGT